MTEEKLEFSRNFLIFGNLALLAWVFIAFDAMWLYNQIYGWLLLVFSAALIFMILRRLGCSSCYYCKSCTNGFGRLAGVFFGTRYTKKGSVGNRTGFIAFTYLLIFPLPAAFLSLTFFQEISIIKVFVLGCLLVLSVYSLTTWFKKN